MPAEQLSSRRSELYQELEARAQALLQGETELIANAANLVALLYHSLPDLNWAGFYFLKGDELVLGPFQGKPACVRIEMGKGVCGTAAVRRETVIVANVHEFPGHIACDSASNSELVIPLIREGRVIGVLDVDSPEFDRFGDEEKQVLELIVQQLVSKTKWPDRF